MSIGLYGSVLAPWDEVGLEESSIVCRAAADTYIHMFYKGFSFFVEKGRVGAFSMRKMLIFLLSKTGKALENHRRGESLLVRPHTIVGLEQLANQLLQETKSKSA